MAVEKKFLPEFKIYSPIDLSKRWFVYYKEDGKRIRQYGNINTFSSFSNRMKAAKQLIGDLTANYVIVLPIMKQAHGWLESKKGLYAKKTYQGLNSKLNCLENWLNGKPLTNDNIKAFFIWLSNHRHKTTYNTYLSKFQLIFSGIEYEYLLDGIEHVRAHSTPAKYFQTHQVRRIKNKIENENPELWLFCQFVYYCFLRPGRELRFLRIGDIQFDDWKIRVDGAFAKNGKQQYVTIPQAFRPALEPLMLRRPTEYVFPSPLDASKPVGGNTMTRKHRKYLDELGFGPDYKLYSWKHTGAVACVRAGVGLKQLQIQLRHHSLEMVDKYLRQLGVWDLDDLETKFPEL